ncbi:MAG: hypothetical protein QOJ52_3049 [Acidimicrobiaceae bacterium]|nr:hypothetical protein [Acidimicrobiaceae bacterium]
MGVSAGPLVPGWSGVVNNGGRTRTPPGLKLSQRRRKNHAKCRDHRDGSSRCCNLGDRSDARCVAPGCSALPDDAQDVVSTGEPALPFGDGQHSCPWRSHPRWARHASPPLPRPPAARSIRPSGAGPAFGFVLLAARNQSTSVTESAASKLVVAMATSGYVRRGADVDDGRQRPVELTGVAVSSW